jgi:hypothetical protein
LDLPTVQEAEEDSQVNVSDIDLDDSAELTPENMQALLARAKRAGKRCRKKSQMAFDTTRARADSGELSTARFRKKRSGNRNGTG